MDVVGECRCDAQQSCNCFLIECQSPLSILYDASCNQDEGGRDFPVSIAIANCELSSCCIFVCVPPTTQIGSHGGIVGG